MPDPADPAHEPPPTTQDEPAGGACGKRSVEAGVRQQRQHLRDLDGEDPLRGGLAD